MKDWEQYYKTRTILKHEAIGMIKPSSSIYLAAYCNEPQTFVEEMVNQRERLFGSTLYINVVGSLLQNVKDDILPFFRIRSFLNAPWLGNAWGNVDCDYIPVNVSELPKLLSQLGIDITLIQVSPPDDQGNCCFGISVDSVKAAVQQARIVIAEVNDQVPFTYGDTMVSVQNIDYFVSTSRPLLTIPLGEISEIEKKIGENVADLIPDGATIQWGIGSIPSSVIRSLVHKKELGVHSGSINDSVIELVEKGIITNSHKTVLPNKMVCTTLIGTKELFRYADHNPNIELHPANFTHASSTLSKIDHFHAINSALEVDITGQVNAEEINNRIIAGVGGQMDFIRGAQSSKGGKAIIALPSTTRDGKTSKIKTSVSPVTTLKSEVQYIVTEYGVATLFGKSLKERAIELISISHPDFRQELEYQMKRSLL
ncbi:acetyl-CoA hydrolase/transferase C-terminal domain-containing protein [Neobacillus niacini]|uniref:acetyl-CoA hydrolase/transferase family protein n=1 Tax=Neobacillus niacini TaxID=86668 RepID=UPI002FFF99F5